MNQQRGFTLLEMMLVLALDLSYTSRAQIQC